MRARLGPRWHILWIGWVRVENSFAPFVETYRGFFLLQRCSLSACDFRHFLDVEKRMFRSLVAGFPAPQPHHIMGVSIAA